MKNEWKRIGNGQIKIKLTQGKVALIDEVDMETIGAYRWCAHWNGRHWYAATGKKRQGKSFLLHMHRAILRPPQKIDVDHINRNGLDNRRQNLRTATRSQNNANKPKYKMDGDSLYKGVSRSSSKTNPWKAEIKVDGNRTHLGVFSREAQAALAYNTAALEAWGEFAYLNEVPQ